MVADSTIQGYISVPPTPARGMDRLDQNFVLDVSRLTIPTSMLDDDVLFDFFHDFIAGVTGLGGQHVVPRWQENPPNLEAFGNNWCGFGITAYKTDTFAAEVQKVGFAELHRHEEMEIQCSFYGTNAAAYARLLRDGMQVSQNLESFSLNNMGLINSGDLLNVPSLVKERWQHRVDFPFYVRRQIVREYPILELLGSNITVNNEHYIETIAVPT